MALRVDKNDQAAMQITTAIQTGETARVKVLLEQDADLATAIITDEKGAGRTLLHIATDWPGHFPNVGATITVLAQAGADPNAGLYDSPIDACETPLHWAASSDDVEAVQRPARQRCGYRGPRRGVHRRHSDVGCGDFRAMAGGARPTRPGRQNHADAISGARAHRARTRVGC